MYASMRPGQTAPEFPELVEILKNGIDRASMRPGQTAPEFENAKPIDLMVVVSFNEAGADCPGILRQNPLQPPQSQELQ